MSEIFKHGSRWVRFDCHLHTKEDTQFIFAGSNGEFYQQYIQGLLEKKISVGVITNHNKFNRHEFKQLRSEANKNDIYLLAGVELNAKEGRNGIHMLIVFSEAWHTNTTDEDFINKFLVSVSEGQENFATKDGKTNTDLIETIKKLETYAQNGRDYFIIMAHVDGDNGFFKDIEGGLIKHLSDNSLFRENIIGFQKNKSTQKREHVSGEYALVEGSDPKKIDDIGRGESSYIKIGDFNFEAVKYALQSKEIRVSKEPLQPQNARIVSVSFEGGKLNDKRLFFSPSMNNLIGIRGSGKSSIIEAIRYGLDIPFGGKTADVTYKNDLVKALLGSGGKITIEAVDRADNRYRIQRIYGHSPEIYRNDEPVSVDARTLLGKPLYFGQKDLSNTGSGFEDDLMEKLIGDKTKELTHSIVAKQHEVRLAVQKLASYKTLAEQKEETRKKITELNIRKADFEKYGLDEKLKKQTIFDKDALHLAKLKEKLNDYCAEVTAFISTNRNLMPMLGGHKSLHNQDIFDEVDLWTKELGREFEEVFSKMETLCVKAKTFDVTQQKFLARFESLKEEFAAIQREINMPNLRADDYVAIEKAIQTEQLKLSVLEKSETEQAELVKKIETLLSELNTLYHDKFKSIQNHIQAINNMQEFIQIDIGYKENKSALEEFLRAVFSGTGLSGADYQKLAEYADMIEIYKDRSSINQKLGGSKPLAFNQRFDEKLGECLTFEVPHKITINYKGKELSRHSLGQRASALIIFILTQKENDIIIIDQPEDDLDNQTVYNEVIKELLRLKNETQFIFATHNANIPVLGDCEQVIICSYDEEKIDIEAGSIDKHTIQERIVNIMEGGSEAFDKRREIYNLWKH